jgi:hypothetical protein
MTFVPIIVAITIAALTTVELARRAAIGRQLEGSMIRARSYEPRHKPDGHSHSSRFDEQPTVVTRQRALSTHSANARSSCELVEGRCRHGGPTRSAQDMEGSARNEAAGEVNRRMTTSIDDLGGVLDNDRYH